MINEVDKSDWPPYTCVACYLFNTLKEFDTNINRIEIAQKLEIKVPKNVYNPYSLKETDNKELWGLSSAKATKKINSILSEKFPFLAFRHIPLNTIPYQMYDEVADELFAKEANIGIGYDFSDISNQIEMNRHVSFLRKSANSFFVEDFYMKKKVTIIDIKWNTLLQSVNKINDGFWVIGKSSSIITSII